MLAAHAFVAGHLFVHLLLHVLLLLARDERGGADGGEVVTVRLRLPERVQNVSVIRWEGCDGR